MKTQVKKRRKNILGSSILQPTVAENNRELPQGFLCEEDSRSLLQSFKVAIPAVYRRSWIEQDLQAGKATSPLRAWVKQYGIGTRRSVVFSKDRDCESTNSAYTVSEEDQQDFYG